MTRIVDAPDFIIANGAQFSNIISSHLRDAYMFVVFPPATLPEADCQLQVWTGSAWAWYDATNFSAGVDNYKVFDGRGTQYRIGRRAGNVAGARTFELTKRVSGSGA